MTSREKIKKELLDTIIKKGMISIYDAQKITLNNIEYCFDLLSELRPYGVTWKYLEIQVAPKRKTISMFCVKE